MTRSIPPSDTDMKAFAENFSLTQLTQDHLKRMRELAPIAAELGGKLPRPQHKSDMPAPCFKPTPTIFAK